MVNKEIERIYDLKRKYGYISVLLNLLLVGAGSMYAHKRKKDIVNIFGKEFKYM